MKNYLFYLQGLGREQWQEAINRNEAYQIIWESLSDNDRDKLVELDCIDEEKVEV